MSKIDQSEADFFLDITGEVCPLTFVKTKLQLERMAPGQTLLVRLNDGEPLENVPRSAAELGHRLLASELERAGDAAGPAVHRLLIRKGDR